MASNLTEVSSFSANVVGPDAGNKVTAASVRVMGTALANRTQALVDGKIVVKSGITFLGNTGCHWVNNGDTHLVGVTTIDDADAITVDDLTVTATLAVTGTGVQTIASGCQFVAQAGSTSSIQGRMKRRSRVSLSAAVHSVGPADGDRFTLAPTTANHIITLLSVTGQIANDSEILEFILPDMRLDVTCNSWTFKRESGTVVADIWSDGGFSASSTVQFEFVGSAWRLGLNSGFVLNGATPVGVVPGTGA
jgi:hypothetical protein